MGCRNFAHTAAPIAECALVSLDCRPWLPTPAFSNSFPAYIDLLRAKAYPGEALVIRGSLSLLTRSTTSKEDGGVAMMQLTLPQVDSVA